MVIKLSDLSYVRIYKYDDGSNGDICILALDPSGNTYTVAFSIYPEKFYVRLMINGNVAWKISG